MALVIYVGDFIRVDLAPALVERCHGEEKPFAIWNRLNVKTATSRKSCAMSQNPNTKVSR